jgi:hypothetical protein
MLAVQLGVTGNKRLAGSSAPRTDLKRIDYQLEQLRRALAIC